MSEPRTSPLRLSLVAGLSSAFFSLLWDAIQSFLTLGPHEKTHELVVIAATAIGMLIVIEPILERIGAERDRESSRRENSFLVRMGALLVIVTTTLLHGLLHEQINRSISVYGMIVISQWVGSLVAPCVITYSWLYGARMEHSQARWYGLVAGLIVGLAAIGLTLFELHFIHASSGPAAISAQRAAMPTLVFATFILCFMAPIWITNGYLGGLAIDRRWCRHAWRGIAAGLIAAAAVGASFTFVVSGIVALEVGGIKTSASLPQLSWSFTLFVETVVVNAGWALGVLIAHDADLLLGWRPRPSMTRAVWREVGAGAGSAAAMFALGSLLSLGAISISGYLTALSATQTSGPTAQATIVP